MSLFFSLFVAIGFSLIVTSVWLLHSPEILEQEFDGEEIDRAKPRDLPLVR